MQTSGSELARRLTGFERLHVRQVNREADPFDPLWTAGVCRPEVAVPSNWCFVSP